MSRARIPAEVLNKVVDGSPHVVDALRDGQIQLVVNTTRGASEIRDSYSIRRHALLTGVPYFTTMSAALAGIESLEAGAEQEASSPERCVRFKRGLKWAASSHAQRSKKPLRPSLSSEPFYRASGPLRAR